MHDGHGYGVRIRRPPDAADEWAADLALIIAPIIGESPDDLEDALLSGILVVAQGLPYDEAKQLVDVFIGLGAQADVVDVPPEPDLAPGMGSLSGLMPQVGDGPPPRIAGTQPFSVAGLRRALEAAQRPPPVAEPPPPDAFAPPPMAPPPGAFAPPPVATRTSTRPLPRRRASRLGASMKAPDCSKTRAMTGCRPASCPSRRASRTAGPPPRARSIERCLA